MPINQTCLQPIVRHASVNSSCAHPPRANSREFAFFSYGWQIPRGLGHLSCQMPGGGDKSRGQMPRPKSTTEFVA